MAFHTTMHWQTSGLLVQRLNVCTVSVLVCIFQKTHEGEMLIRSKRSTLLQMFCELSLYTQVIFKSMREADDAVQSTPECEGVNA